MTETPQQTSADTVRAYFDAVERHDADAVRALFADDVVVAFPLAPNGGPEPWAVFDGKEDAMGYINAAFANLSQTAVTDLRLHESNDGHTVFAEANGDMVRREGSVPYHNVYVYKFTLDGGRIMRVDEYANPVAFAKLMGMPVG